MPLLLDIARLDPFLAAALSLAAGWTGVALLLRRGVRQLPHWDRVAGTPESLPTASLPTASLPTASLPTASLPTASLPTASIIVAARDEAGSLASTVRSWLAVRAVDEVIVVDDRSADETPAVLAALAAANPRLIVVTVSTLPAGWLGKTHALSLGAARASGDWLVFTDADVLFAPDAVERALRLAQATGADHIAGIIQIDLRTLRERVLIGAFRLHFHLGMQTWRVRDPRSHAAVGVGGFNAVRRAAYDAAGGHQAVRLAVIDDIELARELKARGARSQLVITGAAVQVRWYDGVRDTIRGLTKNFFAGAGYNPALSIAVAGAMVATHVAPLALLLFAATPVTRVVAAIAYAAQVAAYVAAEEPWLVGVCSPAGALLAAVALLRSTVLTLVRGAVVWRLTRYDLTLLRAFHHDSRLRRAALWRAREDAARAARIAVWRRARVWVRNCALGCVAGVRSVGLMRR